MAAGQQSTIASASAVPTEPVACDAEALTAWARPPVTSDTHLAQEAQDISGLEQLTFDLPVPSPWAEIQTNLHDLDLDKWASEKRDWFARQFPWIFEFQDALAKEKEANPQLAANHQPLATAVPDYVGLLLQSGDIWQFRYPQDWLQPIPVLDPNSMIRLASLYGLDEQWLVTHALIPARITNSEQRTTNHESRTTNNDALDQWAQSLESQTHTCTPRIEAGVLLDYGYACTYVNIRLSR